jgi:hypothetical protein
MSSTRERSSSQESAAPYDIALYVDEDGGRPIESFLDSCPDAVENRVSAVAIAVAEAPPHQFAGGGMWEAMHGEMKGWHEIRVDHRRTHYRVFCLLDTRAQGRGPLLVLVDGRRKPRGTTLSPREYAAIRSMGQRYWSMQPRPLA